MRLDKIDFRILQEIQKNGRISKTRLAQVVGLSPSPCWERLRRLEEAQLIRAYGAEVDLDKIAPTIEIIVLVVLARHTPTDFERFEAAVMAHDDVVACEAVIGEVDYVIRVIARDVAHYQQRIEALLNEDVGIKQYFSHIRTKTIKHDRGKALDFALSEYVSGDKES